MVEAALTGAGLLICVFEKIVTIKNLIDCEMKQDEVKNQLIGYEKFLQELKSYSGFTDSDYFKHKAHEMKIHLDKLENLLITHSKGNMAKNIYKGTSTKIKQKLEDLNNIKKDLLDVAKLVGDDVPSRTIRNKKGAEFWRMKFGNALDVDLSHFVTNLENIAVRGNGYIGEVLQEHAYTALLPCGGSKKVCLSRFASFVSIVGASEVELHEDDVEDIQDLPDFKTVSDVVQFLKKKKMISTPLANPDASTKHISFPKQFNQENPTELEVEVTKWMSEALKLVPCFWDNGNIIKLKETLMNEKEGTFLLRYSTSMPGNIKLLVKKSLDTVKEYTLLCKSTSSQENGNVRVGSYWV